MIGLRKYFEAIKYDARLPYENQIQWGLEYRTFEYRTFEYGIHSKTERFIVLISNVLISNDPDHLKTKHLSIQNGRSKLGCFI